MVDFFCTIGNESLHTKQVYFAENVNT